MIAALWSNPNWDDDEKHKGNRKRAISGIEDDYQEAIEAIELAFSGKSVEEEEKLSDSNPFFAASERGLKKVDKYIDQRGHTAGEDNSGVDYMKDVDQV